MGMKNNIVILFFLGTLSLLSGCTTLQVASLATMAFTGKGFGDHALSAVTGKDCAFFNIVQGENVCMYENTAEMILLADGQDIDDSLKAIQQQENNQVGAYLVIGSFSDQKNATSYQSEYKQWNSSVVSDDQLPEKKYRVVVGPMNREDLDHMKKSLIDEGISSPWLVML